MDLDALRMADVYRLAVNQHYGRAGSGAMRISELALSPRARRGLENQGIVTVADLVARSPKELKYQNFSKVSLNEVRVALAKLSLSLVSDG